MYEQWQVHDNCCLEDYRGATIIFKIKIINIRFNITSINNNSETSHSNINLGVSTLSKKKASAQQLIKLVREVGFNLRQIKEIWSPQDTP